MSRTPRIATRRRQAITTIALSAIAPLAMLSPAAAQTAAPAAASGGAWPNRAIKLITPWSAGSGTDIIAHLFADRLRVDLGVPVLVENRTGAAGNIGTEYLTRQPADGYSLLMTSASLSIAPSLYRKLGFDPVKDLAPVCKLATAPLLVLVNASSPIRSISDLVAQARAKPGAITYGSFGNGSPSHLIGESINQLAGITMTHVPYTGGGAATDLQAGTLSLAILDALSQTPQVKAGKLRALALNGTQRLPALPDVPTLIEAGIAFDLVGWQAMFAPAGTPPDIIARMNAAVNRIAALPEIQTRMLETGLFPVIPATTAEQWTNQFRADVNNWAAVVKRSGATIN